MLFYGFYCKLDMNEPVKCHNLCKPTPGAWHNAMSVNTESDLEMEERGDCVTELREL